MAPSLRIRRISAKLLLAVVAAVVVPFVGFAIFVDEQMAQRLSKEVVLHSLKGLAADLAGRVDADLDERNLDIQLWTAVLSTRKALGEQVAERVLRPAEDVGLRPRSVVAWRAGERAAPGEEARFEAVDFFDQCVALKRVYDLVLLIDVDGRLAACNSRWPSGEGLAEEVLAELRARDYRTYEWFERCAAGQPTNVGRQITDLVPLANEEPGIHPENYHLGFGGPVRTREGEVVGVLYALVNWSHVQGLVEDPLVVNVFQGLVGPEAQPSAYAWIWDNDADTIIAHPRAVLYDQKVSGPRVNLPELVAAAQSADWGLYPEYTFRGERKNAAFKRTSGRELGGFGWVVGVGIDNSDIFMAVDELRALLKRATLLVVLVALLWTMVIARRATQPIVALQAMTRRVAAGDLDARIPVTSDDELGDLARDFNRMTADLKANREQLVRAEKDAAWREMAQQVAHDIKNPLTPIKLSAGLLRRAKDERSPRFDEIFDSTIDTIGRQVEHLREIASDFQALTGAGRGQPSLFALEELVAEVLELERAWAEALGVVVRFEVADSARPGLVRVDRGLLRRVLVNVVSNAFQAMPEGGELAIAQMRAGGQVVLELTDTGLGLSEEARAHLFEPYFTTKSQGTGLGLAIARRVLGEMGGGDRPGVRRRRPAGRGHALPDRAARRGERVKAAVFATGATGFLGEHLVRALVASGRRVHALVRSTSSRAALAEFGERELVWHAGDVTDAAGVARALAEARAAEPELDLVHAAACISYAHAERERVRRVNVEGTWNVLGAARSVGVRRAVHVSSLVAVGPAPPGAVLDEDAPYDPRGLDVAYMTTKRAAEELALGMTGELYVCAVLPAAIFGPSRAPANTSRFLCELALGRLGPFAPPGALSVVDVRDVAAGVLLALERGQAGRRYLLSAAWYEARELFALAARCLGGARAPRWRAAPPVWAALAGLAGLFERARPELAFTRQSLAMLGARFAVSSARAERELGFAPRAFEQTLADTIAFLRAEGRLPPGGGAPAGGAGPRRD